MAQLINNRSKKNHMINGNFDFWQRATVHALSGVFSYTADRIQSYGGVNASTVSRQTATGLDGSNFTYRHQRNVGTSGVDLHRWGYAMEAQDSIPLSGRTVTFSFKLRAGADFSPANVTFSIHSNTGAEVSGLNLASIKNSKTIVPTADWVRYSVTAVLDSNVSQIGMQILTSANVGTAGANDWFEVTQVMLHEGSVVVPFTRAGLNMAQELQLCRRYYEKSYSVATPPGSLTNAGAEFWNNRDNTLDNLLTYPTVSFSVVKRSASMTITTYSPITGVSGIVADGWSGTDLAALSGTIIAVSDAAFTARNGAVAQALANKIIHYQWIADAEL